MRNTIRFTAALHALSRACAAAIVSLFATLAAWGAALPPPPIL